MIHWIYGVTLGYGYKPYRFLFVIFLLILLFSILFYLYEYKTIFYILNPNSQKQIELRQKNFLKRKFYINIDKKEYDIPYLAVFWHSIFISSSLLLGLRFKKEWIRTQDNSFLIIASIEWVLGIVLYIIFVLFVRTFRFESLKIIFGL